MVPKHFTIVSLTIALTTLFYLGCNKKDDKDVGTSGQAKVTMSSALATSSLKNQTQVGDVHSQANSCPAGTCPDPSTVANFEIKLVSIGIGTEMTGQTGYGSAIYINPDCPTEQNETEINGKFYKYTGFMACDDEAITTYLDLAQTQSEVNASLNSQYLPIAPGSYKRGFVDFCNDGDFDGINYRITMSSDTSLPAEIRGQTLEIISGACGFDTPQMDPTMDVAEGEAVTVNFEYDLTNSVYYRTATSDETAGSNCKLVGSSNYYMLCAQPPTFSASFAK